MSKQQIIFTGDTPDARVDWALAEDGKLVAGGASVLLAEFAANARSASATSLMVVLPGERFVARQVTTPARSSQQLLQTARFLLEDDIAGSMDDLHLAVSAAAPGDKKNIVAVEHAYITDWLSILKQHDLKPDILTADFLCLRADDADAIVLVDDRRMLLNIAGTGFAAERTFAEKLTGDLLTQLNAKRVTLLLCDGVRSPAFENTEIRRYRIEDRTALIKLYLASIFNTAPPNLLQGDLEPGLDWSARLKPWRQAAAMLAASIVLSLGLLTLEAIKVNSSAEQITKQATVQFETAYPDVSIRNLNSQARQLAGVADGARSEFLNLLSVLTTTLEENDGVELSLLNYDRTGTLTADVQFATIEDLDDLKEGLNNKGVRVEEGRTLTPVGNVYTGKLILRVGS